VNQVLDSTGSGSLSGIIAGIDWAHTKGAKVVSMSLSTTYTTSVDADCDAKFPSLAAAINNAVAAGVIIVAAAGNSGSAGVGAPGCIGNSIAVGAVDGSDNIASFSGRGSAMADHGLVAPGVSVYSSYKGGTYATASGTSMATPAVAGTVALMLAIDQNLAPSDVKNALSENTCKQSSNPSCPTGSVPNNSYGSGRVDSYTSTTTSGSTTSDFSLSTSTSSITIPKGKSGSLTVTIQSLNNLASSNIMLTLTPATSGISYGFSPSSVSLAAGGDAQSTLTINVGKNAPAGTHSFTITAVSKDTTPELSHSGQITVKVSKR
jgi:subtilisin family serine protease